MDQKNLKREPSKDIQMTNKHMKKYSASYVIRGFKIKTAMRYYYTHMRMATIPNTKNTKYWQGQEATRTLIHCWWK